MYLAPKFLEQYRNRPPTSTTYTIERHPEPPRADLLDVDHRETEDVREVPLQRRRILPHHAESLPAIPDRPLSASARTAAPASPSRKIPSGPTNLSAFHSIGLWLAVRISPAPAMLLHRHLHRRRGHDTEVDDATTHMRPAIAACANMGPLVRESRPSTTSGFPWLRAHEPSAAAWRVTSSGVRSVPTCPRIPEHADHERR